MMRFLVIPTMCMLLFACSEQPADITPLPQILLTADSISWTEKRPTTLTYIVDSDTVHLNGGTKYRGGSSSKYWKHSYALKLEDAYPLAGLTAAKAFVLNASYIDKTLMRHRFSFDVYRAMHPNNIAPVCRYAELYENRDYRGIYVIMERINAGRMGLKNADGSALWKEPLIFYPEMPESQEADNPHQQKYPDIKKTDYTDDLLALRDFLFSSPDEVFSRDVFKHFDKQSLIDWQLILLLSNNSDGQLKNVYLYREGEDNPYKFALWDYDHSFGRDGDGEYNMLTNVIDENRCIIFARLNALNPDNFNQSMASRYIELRSNGIFDQNALVDLLNGYHKELAPHMDRNAERWPHDADWYHDDHDFEREVATIHEYLDKRIPQLDQRFGYNQ